MLPKARATFALNYVYPRLPTISRCAPREFPSLIPRAFTCVSLMLGLFVCLHSHRRSYFPESPPCVPIFIPFSYPNEFRVFICAFLRFSFTCFALTPFSSYPPSVPCGFGVLLTRTPTPVLPVHFLCVPFSVPPCIPSSLCSSGCLPRALPRSLCPVFPHCDLKVNFKSRD